MTGTSETTSQVVQKYYDTLKRGAASFDPARLRVILAADLRFEGPIAGQIVGAERFITGVSGFAETTRGISMLQKVHDGDTAAALYDAEMPGGAVRFAEFFQVGDGKIQSLRLLYDAAEYRARGGR
jgi:ketosteroid isomerase-like protein